jgi:predicted nuclease of predicted toxin-antitoxin system
LQPIASVGSPTSRLSEYLARLLFDENLAARLVADLQDVYPGSRHIGDLGLLGASDTAIWERARQDDFVLVTKDMDFHRLSVLLGPPPKVIGIRLGNCTTTAVGHLLRGRSHVIAQFVEDQDAGFLALA